VATASERIYELAKDGLREQHAVVDDIRGRGAPVAAAAAVIATLLSKPAFAGGHPSGLTEWSATVVALVGWVLIVAAFVSLYSRRALAFSVDAQELAQALGASDDVVDLLVAEALLARHDANEPAVDALRSTFATALGGLLLEAVGFGVGAALAS
jgi:hypothetical protein